MVGGKAVMDRKLSRQELKATWGALRDTRSGTMEDCKMTVTVEYALQFAWQWQSLDTEPLRLRLCLEYLEI